MVKFFGGVVVGIFLGALTVEILNKRYPQLLDKVEEKGRRAADFAGDFIRRETVDQVSAY